MKKGWQRLAALNATLPTSQGEALGEESIEQLLHLSPGPIVKDMVSGRTLP